MKLTALWSVVSGFYSSIRTYLAIAAFIVWTICVWTISRQLEERKELVREVQVQKEVIVYRDKSNTVSVDAGKKYEAKRKVIQKKLATPDRTLDEIMQSPAGDAVIPGALGLRLNTLSGAASQAEPAASQPH